MPLRTVLAVLLGASEPGWSVERGSAAASPATLAPAEVSNARTTVGRHGSLRGQNAPARASPVYAAFRHRSSTDDPPEAAFARQECTVLRPIGEPMVAVSPRDLWRQGTRGGDRGTAIEQVRKGFAPHRRCCVQGVHGASSGGDQG